MPKLKDQSIDVYCIKYLSRSGLLVAQLATLCERPLPQPAGDTPPLRFRSINKNQTNTFFI